MNKSLPLHTDWMTTCYARWQKMEYQRSGKTIVLMNIHTVPEKLFNLILDTK
jgi:hypothetical protein